MSTPKARWLIYLCFPPVFPSRCSCRPCGEGVLLSVWWEGRGGVGGCVEAGIRGGHGRPVGDVPCPLFAAPFLSASPPPVLTPLACPCPTPPLTPTSWHIFTLVHVVWQAGKLFTTIKACPALPEAFSSGAWRWGHEQVTAALFRVCGLACTWCVGVPVLCGVRGRCVVVCVREDVIEGVEWIELG